MLRNLSSNQLVQISEANSSFYHLLKISTDIPLTITTCYKDIVFNTETYDSGGFLLGIPSFDEDLDLKIKRYKIQLSAVNQANISDFLSNPPYYRNIDVYKLWLDSNGDQVDSPILRFRGYFAGFSDITDYENGTSVMEIDAVSHFVDFERINGRQTNNASQQKYFPDDTGLRHSETKYNDRAWGRA